MVVGWLSFLPLVWWAGIVGPLPAPGSTLEARGTATPKAAWQVELSPPRPGWLLLRLGLQKPHTSPDGYPDLDLRVGDHPEWRASSHQSRERLLIPVGNPPGRLRVTVDSGNGHPGAFRLGVTPLVSAGTLVPGAQVRGTLDTTTRCRLYELSVLQPTRIALRLDPAAGDADLLVFDRHGRPLALCERPRGRKRASLELTPSEPARVVIVARTPQASYGLQVAIGPTKPGPLERFLIDLARTPAQARAVHALERNADFIRIRAYLEHYPGGVPLQLRVLPGLTAHGVERFGTYSQGMLTINPTIKGHRENPQELIDTLLHELVHALLALPRVEGFPLGADVLDSSHDPVLKGAVGAPLRRGHLPEPQASHLERNYGPSASNPTEDYTDINAGAQRLIIKVVRDDLRRSHVGKPTLVFANMAARLRHHRAGRSSAK